MMLLPLFWSRDEVHLDVRSLFSFISKESAAHFDWKSVDTPTLCLGSAAEHQTGLFQTWDLLFGVFHINTHFSKLWRILHVLYCHLYMFFFPHLLQVVMLVWSSLATTTNNINNSKKPIFWKQIIALYMFNQGKQLTSRNPTDSTQII